MNTINTNNTFNKDNSGSAVLLGAMFITIVAALFSTGNASAKVAVPTAATTKVATVTTVATDKRADAVKFDTIVVTATRLK